MTFGNRYQNNYSNNYNRQQNVAKSNNKNNYQTRHNKKFYKNKAPRHNTNLTIINTNNNINSAFQSIAPFDFRTDHNNNNSNFHDDNYNYCQDVKSNFTNFEFYGKSTSTVSSSSAAAAKIELITVVGDTNKENEQQTCTNGSAKSFDDEIVELFSADGWVNPYSEENYYDNDLIINSQEILKRWNLKRQSNPELNLTMCNYRSRMSKGAKCAPLPERSFVPGLFEDVEKSIQIYQSGDDDKIDTKRPVAETSTESTPSSDSNPTQANLIKKDENTLNERVGEIRARFEVTKQACRQALDDCHANLKQMFDEQTHMARMSCGNYFELQQTLGMLHEAYQVSLANITDDYRNRLKQYENASNSQIGALRELFNSGNYQKGQLDNYVTLELYQPSAKRRKYDDNGYRVMLLPEKVIKNIIKEDELYYHFYGFPAPK